MSWREYRATSETRQETDSGLSAEWGEHAPLIRWFLSVKDNLPTEPFCLWREGKCSLYWINPGMNYRHLVEGIQTGPDFEYANELVSILEQLKDKFGEGEQRGNIRKKHA